MPIRPFDLHENIQERVEIPDELNQILIDAGVQKPNIIDQDKSEIRKIFNDAGASIEAAAKQISQVMSNGKDVGRLKAAEMVLKVHDVLAEIDGTNVPQINITIQGSEHKTLINLVLPKV